jgi:tRNA (guanine-N7-)-methyltransferase
VLRSPYASAPRLPGEGSIDPRLLFERETAQVELEIGPGRGWFMIERLSAEPAICMLGLEIRRKWASVVDERLRSRGLGARGRVFAEDARLSLPRFEDASLAVVYLHFPDPWWKKRHEKRLVFTPALVADVARVLAPGGELFLQTDVQERAESYERTVAADPRLVPWAGSARVEENPYGARSPRERRALKDGLPVTRMRWRRAEAPR